jgi:ribonucleotide reductase alpha subunit
MNIEEKLILLSDEEKRTEVVEAIIDRTDLLLFIIEINHTHDFTLDEQQLRRILMSLIEKEGYEEVKNKLYSIEKSKAVNFLFRNLN